MSKITLVVAVVEDGENGEQNISQFIAEGKSIIDALKNCMKEYPFTTYTEDFREINYTMGDFIYGDTVPNDIDEFIKFFYDLEFITISYIDISHLLLPKYSMS